MAKLCLKEGKFNYTCFFCHQAVEKSLKGLLVLNSMSPPRIHNLVELSHIYGNIDNDILKFRPEIMDLSQFYIPTRYPNAIVGSIAKGMPNKDLASRAIEGAGKIVLFFRDKIEK